MLNIMPSNVMTSSLATYVAKVLTLHSNTLTVLLLRHILFLLRLMFK